MSLNVFRLLLVGGVIFAFAPSMPVWAFDGVANTSRVILTPLRNEPQDVAVKKHPTPVQPPKPTQRIVVVQPLETIRQLVGQGNFKQARLILSALEKAISSEGSPDIDPLEISFLYGLIEIGEGNHLLAINRFGDILLDHPNLVRVRLELARALFLEGHDNRAKYHFDLAGQGALPENAKQNIERFLTQIRERKVLTYNFSFGLVPDSNINSATDSQTVDLFGLPFALDEEAQSRSGIGVMAAAGVEYYGKLQGDWRLSGNFQAQRHEYKGKAFDDTLVSVALGPGRVLKDGFANLQVIGFNRWFGGEKFNQGLGVRSFFLKRISDKRRMRFSLRAQKFKFYQNPIRNGWTYTGTGGVQFGLDSSSFYEIYWGISREEARVKSLKNWALRTGLSYYKELKRGFTLRPFAEVQHRPFDAIQPAFGVKRKDWSLTGGFDVTVRRWNWKGFAPYLSYSLTHNSSTIDLFKYNRHRLETGLTRSF